MPKKLKSAAPIVTRIIVIDDVGYEDLYEDRYDTEDPNGRPNTSESHYIRGIKVVDATKYSNLEVGFKVVPNKTYYLLYAIYSTGDSFGHDDGRIAFIDMFESKKVADANAKRLEKHYRAERGYGKNRYSVKLTNSTGKSYAYCPPWMGYFESLSNIEVKSVQVQE